LSLKGKKSVLKLAYSQNSRNIEGYRRKFISAQLSRLSHILLNTEPARASW